MMVVLSSCTSDQLMESDLNSNETGEQKDSQFFISLNITVPGGDDTRSTTNSDGGSGDIVVPSLNEKIMDSARIYFCTKDADDKYTIIASCETSSDGGPFNKPNYTLGPSLLANSTHRLEIEVDINDLKNIIGKQIYILMVGNTDQTRELLSGWKTATKDVDKDPAEAKFSSWSPLTSYVSDYNGSLTDKSNGRIMPLVSADPFSVTFGSPLASNASDADVIDAIKSLFNEKSTNGYGYVYHCDGILQLERALARLDFKYTQVEGADVNTDYSYPVGKTNFQVRLDRLVLVNLNTQSYLFRHTIEGTRESAFGVTGKTPKLLGVENGFDTGDKYNWIYGSDWSYGTGATKGTTDLRNLLTWEVIDETEGIKKLVPTSSFDPNVNITLSNLYAHHPAYDTDAYRPWAYIYENTIPMGSMMTDENIYKYATGIMFKFVLLANPDESNSNKRPDLTFEMIGTDQCPANITKSSEEGAAATTITITNSDSQWVDVEYVDGKYELTYFAWIIHNEVDPVTITENNQGVSNTYSVPGPMAYGVVRNNVYQTTISSIKDIPNPREPRSMFLEITVNIAPWNDRWDEEATLY